MNNQQIAAIVLVVGLSLVFFGAQAATTIENTTTADVVEPTWAWTYLDGDGTEIIDIDTATISGRVTFKAQITNFDKVTPAVTAVHMNVWEQDSNGGKGTQVITDRAFTEAQYGEQYELSWDTTEVTDGEYILEFTYVQDGQTSSPFSVLYFGLSDGEGNFDLDRSLDLPLLGEVNWKILASIGVIVVALIIYRMK